MYYATLMLTPLSKPKTVDTTSARLPQETEITLNITVNGPEVGPVASKGVSDQHLTQFRSKIYCSPRLLFGPVALKKVSELRNLKIK